jgi:hypothetical protein
MSAQAFVSPALYGGIGASFKTEGLPWYGAAAVFASLARVDSTRKILRYHIFKEQGGHPGMARRCPPTSNNMM